jgi:hypothetical protein
MPLHDEVPIDNQKASDRPTYWLYNPLNASEGVIKLVERFAIVPLGSRKDRYSKNRSRAGRSGSYFPLLTSAMRSLPSTTLSNVDVFVCSWNRKIRETKTRAPKFLVLNKGKLHFSDFETDSVGIGNH